MAKTSLTHRFSDTAKYHMAVLSKRWNLDRTATIERALAIASAETEPEVVQKPSGMSKTEPHILPRDPNEVAKVVERPLTREEREAKIDAFQRKMAKGKK